jgi:hypothetical protein
VRQAARIGTWKEIGKISGRNGKVTDRTESRRSVWSSPRLSRFFVTPTGRFVRVVAYPFLVLGVVFGIYIFGRAIGDREVRVSNSTILQLRNENQKLVALNSKATATNTDLQSKLKDVQARLEAILPEKDTYHIIPNQSLIVAGGHLTVGLVGSPANQNILINVNGKQHTVPAGEVIDVAIDSSTSCQVTVQSFDMFAAVIHATCAAAKPQ